MRSCSTRAGFHTFRSCANVLFNSWTMATLRTPWRWSKMRGSMRKLRTSALTPWSFSREFYETAKNWSVRLPQHATPVNWRNRREIPEKICTARVMSAFMYQQFADQKSALVEFDRLLEDAEKYRLPSYRYDARFGRARCMVELGAAAEVEQSLHKIADSAKYSGDRKLSASYFTAWGTCLLKLDRFDEAIAAFEKARSDIAYIGETFRAEIPVQIGMELGNRARDARIEALRRSGFVLPPRGGNFPASADGGSMVALAIASCAGLARLGGSRGCAEATRRLPCDDRKTACQSEGTLLHRRTLNDNKYEAFSLAVGLALDEHRETMHSTLLNASRARAFLDELGTHAGNKQAQTRVELKDLIKNTGDAAVVSYFVLPERLVAWVISKGKSECVQIQITETKLKELVKDHLIWRCMTTTKRMSRPRRRCSVRLWAPIDAKIAPGQRVIVIPHGILQYVPFPALRDDKSFLVEKRANCASIPARAPGSRSSSAPGTMRQLSKRSTSILTETGPFARTETLELETQIPDG